MSDHPNCRCWLEPIGILQDVDVNIDFERPREVVMDMDVLELGPEPDEPQFITIDGFPLADLGLKRALVEYPDGSRVPFWGFSIQLDETVAAAIARTIGSGKLVNDAGEELIPPDLTGAEAFKISLSRRQ